MRANGLLAPHRVGRTGAKPHDGTIITDKVNEMWGTDMTQTITIREGTANVFVAVEHSNSEVVGIHVDRTTTAVGAHARPTAALNETPNRMPKLKSPASSVNRFFINVIASTTLSRTIYARLYRAMVQ